MDVCVGKFTEIMVAESLGMLEGDGGFSNEEFRVRRSMWHFYTPGYWSWKGFFEGGSPCPVLMTRDGRGRFPDGE